MSRNEIERYALSNRWLEEQGVPDMNAGNALAAFHPARSLSAWTQRSGARRVKTRGAVLNQLIRRWLIHVLPKGFARVRHNGFMGAAACKTLQAIRLHLGADPKPEPILPEPRPHTCPCCCGTLTFLREIAPIRPLRAPPLKTA